MMASVLSGDKYYGDMCECAGNLSSSDPLAGCRVPPHIGWGVTSVCSGRGQCVCGACECDSDRDMGEIYGEWCQCDNLQCDRDKSGQTSTYDKLYRAVVCNTDLCTQGLCAGVTGPVCVASVSVSQAGQAPPVTAGRRPTCVWPRTPR